MAVFRLVLRLLSCLSALLLSCGPDVSGAVTAYVCWDSHIDSNTGISNVTITNGSKTVNISEDQYQPIALMKENGPDSYWSVSVSCLGASHRINDTYLFLNSSASMYYTLCIYDKCTMNDVPKVWVQALSEPDPRTPILGIDEASLVVHNNLSTLVNISQRSDNCYKCEPYQLGTVVPGQRWTLTLDTSFGWTIYANSSDGRETASPLCSVHHDFVEHSKYALTLKDGNCTLERLNMVSAYAVYLPILYAMVLILGLALVWGLGTVVWWYMKDRRCTHNLHIKRVDRVTARDLGSPRAVATNYGAATPQETEPLNRASSSSLNSGPILVPDTANEQAPPTSPGDSPKKMGKRLKRLTSLDAFRGFSLMIMIFVNYGGGSYWFFNHSRWNGVTVADLVFPWFVWIMGVSIVFSYKGRRKDPLWRRLYQVVRRTVILFGLGIFLNNGFNLSHWRIPGVLQRFAVTYFVVALTELFTSELYHAKKHWFTPTISFLRVFRDITANVFQWCLILVFEFLWLIITFTLPVNGCTKGYLGPGGLSDHGRHYNCTGGAAGEIDRWLFHENHIYQSPTAKDLYKLVRPYDPEGVLGSLNSIVICFLGVQAGRILVTYRSHYNILLRFLIWGVFLGGLGTVLCEGQKNEGFIPLNKNLWSLSFILVMAGSGFILLAVFYLVIDVISWWNGAPFKYPGMNSILVYVGSEILQGYFPFSWKHQSDSHLNLLFANLVGVSVWIAIAYYWFWTGFFVKI